MSLVYTQFADYEISYVMMHRLHVALVVERRVNMLRCLFSNTAKTKTERVVVREINRDFEEMKNLRL